MRRVLIVKSAALYNGEHKFYFNPGTTRDSEALHFFLTQFDPGDNYIVHFETEKED